MFAKNVKNMKRYLMLAVFSVLLWNFQIFLLSCKKDKEEEKITDADGNVYDIITINNRVWLAQNLRTTKFNDGSAIQHVTDNTAWAGLSTPAYCFYNNNSANKTTYGALYNWYAVNTGKLCPSGWRVPTDADWKSLENYLGGETVAGGKMKETGTTYWNSPNTGATNDSGFNGRGGGVRFIGGDFGDLKNYGLWWSSSQGGGGAWFRSLYYQNTNLTTLSYGHKNGLSVRCIKI